MKIHLEVLLFLLTLFGLLEALHDDADIPSTDQLITRNGYAAERHRINTEDDYILTLFRIVGVQNGTHSDKKAVLLAHGIHCSSTDWVIMGPGKALAYLLADHGYDVWMINFRGNRYSREHARLNDGEDAFWNFSWQEMGQYDIPAALDYVLRVNGGDKLKLVCHSTGCTSLLVTLSEHPKYNDKIESVNMMAPISIMNHSRSVLRQTAAMLENEQERDGQSLLGWKEVDGQVAESLWGKICRSENSSSIACDNPIFLITGWNIDTLTDSGVFRDAMEHQKGGLSSKTLIHFSQVIATGKFRKFSYSEVENMLMYGSKDPPEYNLKRFSVPVTIDYAERDAIADERDVKWFASALPTKPETSMARSHMKHHMEYLWGDGSQLYDKIICATNTTEQSAASKYRKNPHVGTEGSEKPKKERASIDLKELYASESCKGMPENPTEELRAIVNGHGYNFEYHVLTTDDGYILSLHRIPPKRARKGSKAPHPVILVHGLFLSSFSWLLMGPKKSLGYILANNGYDVWMMNARGNKYSKMHTVLPECSRQFWDFSWDEMGKYDLPSVIDHVLRNTGMKKADVIGFSMGGNIILGMGSERPEYNSKVNVMHLLAPSIIFLKGDPVMKMIASILVHENWLAKLIGAVDQFNTPTLARILSSKLCDFPVTFPICAQFVSAVYGFHREKFDQTLLSVYLKHFPEGISTKTFVHMGQLLLSGKFSQFDEGVDNTKKYKQISPPEYNLTKVTVKVRVYYSDIDETVNVKGMLRFVRKLPSVIGMHSRKDYTHQDYIFPRDHQGALYREIVRNLETDGRQHREG